MAKMILALSSAFLSPGVLKSLCNASLVYVSRCCPQLSLREAVSKWWPVDGRADSQRGGHAEGQWLGLAFMDGDSSNSAPRLSRESVAKSFQDCHLKCEQKLQAQITPDIRVISRKQSQTSLTVELPMSFLFYVQCEY